MNKQSVSTDIYAIYFSAYSAHQIEYDGVVYPSVEHAYHCQRFDDTKIKDEIITARSPYLAWQASQKYKVKQLQDFPSRKVSVMYELCKAKLEQHSDVRQALSDSKNYEIVKHITTGPPADGFWDDGVDGSGRNESGKIWMELRDELSSDLSK